MFPDLFQTVRTIQGEKVKNGYNYNIWMPNNDGVFMFKSFWSYDKERGNSTVYKLEVLTENKYSAKATSFLLETYFG